MTRPSSDRHPMRHMWPKIRVPPKELELDVFGSLFLVRVICGLFGMAISKNILQNIEMAVSQPCFEILWFLCFLHLPNTSRWLLQNWPVSQDSGKRKERWNRWASHRAPCLGGSERSMQCRMPVSWIRQYRPLHHPVNLRLTQAEIENMTTLFRGCDHSSNHRPSTCTWIDDDWR